MSTWAQGAVTCARCAQPVPLREAASISASRVPLWREALLAGTLHRPTCAACGATIDVQVRFLYTDLERGQWIVVEQPDALATWRACEREVLATFDRLAASAPAVITDALARCPRGARASAIGAGRWTSSRRAAWYARTGR